MISPSCSLSSRGLPVQASSAKSKRPPLSALSILILKQAAKKFRSGNKSTPIATYDVRKFAQDII